MLKSLAAIILILFVISVNAQWIPQRTPMQKKNFSTIAAKKYTMAFEYELADGQKVLTGVAEFGAQGLPAALYEKGTNDNGDSITTAETIYKFDGNGRLIKESHSDFVEGSEWYKVYTYSKNDKLVKSNSIHIDPTTTTYTYDAAGKLIKSHTTVRMPAVDKNGEATGKAVDVPNERKIFAYDKAGRLKEEVIYYLMNEEGAKKWSYKTQWTFNGKNQLIKLEHINSDNKVYNTETYEYTGDGLLVKKTAQLDDEPLKTFVYEYCGTCKQSWMK